MMTYDRRIGQYIEGSGLAEYTYYFLCSFGELRKTTKSLSQDNLAITLRVLKARRGRRKRDERKGTNVIKNCQKTNKRNQQADAGKNKIIERDPLKYEMKEHNRKVLNFFLLHSLNSIYNWRLIMNSIIKCSTPDHKFPNSKELFYRNSVTFFFKSLLVQNETGSWQPAP